MEVHHHPHVEKKNFREYFLEFLMIFLAVTLGFFAENLREHINNGERIKNNIRSMIADLKSDTLMYSEVLKNNLYSVMDMHKRGFYAVDLQMKICLNFINS